MGRYRVVFRKSVAKDLRGIPNRDLRRILTTIESLSEEPRPSGTEKLSGQERYRLRQGDYRIIYEINDDEVVVVVVKVGHREDVYRGSQQRAAAAAKRPRR
jgi:mRNA interferase RelE/StbE